MFHCLRPKCPLVLFVFFGSLLQSSTSAFVPSSSSRAISSSASIGSSFTIIQNDVIRHRPSSPTILSTSPLEDDEGDGNDNNANASLLASDDVRRALLASSLAAVTYNVVTLGTPALLANPLLHPGYEKVSPLQFVAALGDPDASSGEGAENWGIWRTDPGPRGLRLRDYELIASSSKSSSGDDEGGGGGGGGGGGRRRPSWLDSNDFFLDENAILMPMPEFPLPPGKYLVTGARAVTTSLTIDADGKWMLDDDDDSDGRNKLYDVTHLPCRAARYRTLSGENNGGGGGGGGGSPSTVRRSDFPVAPGGVMPDVAGTEKQIYSVLFIVGKQGV